ncbi:hypothetical protein C5B42_00030 [Candidatus Cerribacteria bacterium 'Amazon FNV 2010 28 9']|uniref:Uncharacterized protein n=1 Tax=Candidatus Cerribacteria bacterium 'Amazon FNV 2010 28 9' TaxID=2081795 RepID=A0A317JUI3_9BACT|nr:MAG: hypothetical protein C5B42_00030 [Candidatus Cerribacteria bacterium 'Amazon FNV 2010 28 9']
MTIAYSGYMAGTKTTKDSLVTQSQLEKTLDTRLKSFKLEMLEALDDYFRVKEEADQTRHLELLTRIQRIEEIQTVGDYRQSQHSDQLENHEQRLIKTEHKLALL